MAYGKIKVDTLVHDIGGNDIDLSISTIRHAGISSLTDAATITIDLNELNNNFSVTLSGNRTLANPTNITAGQSGSIFIAQDSTGSRTITWGSYWKWAGGNAPTLSTGANQVDQIDYVVYDSTSIHAIATLNYS